MSRFLITSDLHFTDRDRDQYRWELFPWLEKQLLRRHCQHLFILGDITDHKDHHSSRLTNRIVSSLKGLIQKTKVTVHLLKGNHDYIDPKLPFFSFLNTWDLEKLKFYIAPQKIELEDARDVTSIYMLPHSNALETTKPFQRTGRYFIRHVDFVFCHQGLIGALASNGFCLKEGVSPSLLKKTFPRAQIVSGDIHVPQVCSGIYYVGAPYPVHFGDTFHPRVLFWDGGSLISILRQGIQRRVISLFYPEQIKKMELFPGDQVRIQLHLSREDFDSWEKFKKDTLALADKMKLEVFAIELRERKRKRLDLKKVSLQERNSIQSPEEALKKFCALKELPPNVRHTGKDLLQEAILLGKSEK